jgi:BirA family biotin operon repressor/biotin-[acetyl-CoA-carboxylase] ligase
MAISSARVSEGMGYSISHMTAFSFRVLRRLADGEFHSGAALARALGVSRGTVWNGVRALESAGLAVYKVRGRGYRLPAALSLLERNAVLGHAGVRASRFEVEIVDESESTSTALIQRAAAGAAAGTVIAAEWQTKGRGRFGRSWHAEPCGALTFSLLWRFAQGAGALAGLSLGAGVALIRALTAFGASEATLKWPNDVIWHGEKLGGVLIEMQGDALGPSAAVIGIGLNVRLSEAALETIGHPAADLETACGRALDRNELLGVVLGELALVLEQFCVDGFAPLRAEWERYHAYQNQPVEVLLPRGRAERGIARGVAEDGALLFETASGVRRLHSGELSVRPARPTKINAARDAAPRVAGVRRPT